MSPSFNSPSSSRNSLFVVNKSLTPSATASDINFYMLNGSTLYGQKAKKSNGKFNIKTITGSLQQVLDARSTPLAYPEYVCAISTSNNDIFGTWPQTQNLTASAKSLFDLWQPIAELCFKYSTDCFAATSSSPSEIHNPQSIYWLYDSNGYFQLQVTEDLYQALGLFEDVIRDRDLYTIRISITKIARFPNVLSTGNIEPSARLAQCLRHENAAPVRAIILADVTKLFELKALYEQRGANCNIINAQTEDWSYITGTIVGKHVFRSGEDNFDFRRHQLPVPDLSRFVIENNALELEELIGSIATNCYYDALTHDLTNNCLSIPNVTAYKCRTQRGLIVASPRLAPIELKTENEWMCLVEIAFINHNKEHKIRVTVVQRQENYTLVELST